MLVKLIPFYIFGIVVNCAPLQSSFRSEITLNFSDEGFTSSNIFQVACEIPMKNEAIKMLNDQLEKSCRKRFLRKLILFHYQYRDSRELAKSEYSVKKVYQVNLKKEHTLHKFYPEAKKAKILYRSSNGITYQGVMRLEEKGLYKKITSRQHFLIEENNSK
jgi:hypothetical protein